jgi:hypothetical protein
MTGEQSVQGVSPAPCRPVLVDAMLLLALTLDHPAVSTLCRSEGFLNDNRNAVIQHEQGRTCIHARLRDTCPVLAVLLPKSISYQLPNPF